MLKALREELQSFKKNLPEYATREDMEKMASQLTEKVESKPNIPDEFKQQVEEIHTAVEEQGLALQKLNEKQVKEEDLDVYVQKEIENFKQVANTQIV